ncbi:MAG: SDR family NAD(P)-dependent oxidoreductase [Pseudomonadota bacterium]
MGSLEKRVAIVTGAGAGIGAAIARKLATEGAKVLLAELNEESAASVLTQIQADGGEGFVLATDVSQRDQVERMVTAAVEQWGRIDILVNNAWGSSAGLKPIEQMTDDDLLHAFNVGTLGCHWAMMAALPHMKAAGYGRIINMASLNGINAHMYTAHYNMAKEALRALTRTAAREWAALGITCNIVCPSAETAALQALRSYKPEMFAQIEVGLPMQRFGDPDTDVAPVVAFLASEESRFVTGNTLHADGGGHINGVAWDPSSLFEEA